jgi:hypothetical protein
VLLHNVLSDTAYYALIQGQYKPTRSTRGGVKGAYRKCALPKSVSTIIDKLVTDRTLQLQLLQEEDTCVRSCQHTAKLGEMHTAFSHVLLSAHNSRVKGGQNAAFVPICSVDWDNSQLKYGRPGVPLCSSKGACEALKLTLNQGPLHAFLLPGQPATTGSMCLLCTRLHAQLLNDAMAMIDVGARAPILMPPCTNLVNCFGGYHAWALGVAPNTQRIFDRGCAIVGSSALLSVRYSPKDKIWWVDQGPLVWSPATGGAGETGNFRGGVQEIRSSW